MSDQESEVALSHLNNTKVRQTKLFLKENPSSIKITKRILGYQGFSISCLDDKEIFINGLFQLENLLLNSGLKYLSLDIINHIKEHLGESYPINISKRLISINCDHVPIKGPDNVPVYNPKTDNGGCFITRQSKNNCYAYGLFHFQLSF